jgi:predicted signal transduction protein with EAL and GGDEF domain
MLIDGWAVQTSVSAGVAQFPEDATCAEALLRKADIALYRAKANGGGEVHSFTYCMEEAERRRATVAEALREAIEKGEIVVPHYQLLVDLKTANLLGYEVLSRWQSPLLGSVTPSEFIPIALEAGLIDALSYSVLEKACSDALLWPRPLRISFNVAPPQLSDPQFPLQVLAILARTGLAPHRLEIELTEDALLESDRTVLLNLKALKDQGITLALDDFGMGYSSLHLLRTLPLDRVKLDRSFIARVETSEKSRRMVESIINVVHSLDIPLLAEGVETVEDCSPFA